MVYGKNGLNRTMQYGNKYIFYIFFFYFILFKSYYVVWKLKEYFCIYDHTILFKSYYVVWKQIFYDDNSKHGDEV